MSIEDKIKKTLLEKAYSSAKEEAKTIGMYIGAGAGIGLAYYAASWFFWPLAIIPLGPVSGAVCGAATYGARRLYQGGQKIGLIGSAKEEPKLLEDKTTEEQVDAKEDPFQKAKELDEEIDRLLEEIKKKN